MNPLNLPVGSVRAILALLLVGGPLIMVSFGLPVPEAVWMGFGLAIREYFQARAGEGK